MTIVVEGNGVTIIGINAGGGNDGSSKISTDVFDDRIRGTVFGFGINVKSIFMFLIDRSFAGFERVSKERV